MERLPAQQYLPIFNTFSENFHTRMINEAILQKNNGHVTQLTVFTQNSSVISPKTPQLGLKRVQTDEEVRKKVQIYVLPLNWIYIDEKRGTTAELFNFLRRNLDKLSGCMLLDVIFEAFWMEQ